MILHKFGTNSYLESKIQLFWSEFKNDILKLTHKSWKEEDWRGQSYTQWSIMQYYNVLTLVILIYFDIKKNKNVYSTWSYYETKYDLINKKKCLACCNIDLDKILSIFDLPFTNVEDGINYLEIEQTLEIN